VTSPVPDAHACYLLFIAHKILSPLIGIQVHDTGALNYKRGSYAFVNERHIGVVGGYDAG